MEKLPAQPIQGIIDGTAALGELAARGKPVSCAELAEALGLEKTRVNRVLKTLAYQGFAQQVQGRKYVAGPAVHVLAAQALYASGLLRVAWPRLRELEKHGYVVALGALWRNTVSYLYHGNPRKPDNVPLGAMSMHPAEISSIGVALLAEKSDDDVRLLFKGKTLHPTYADGLDGLLARIAKTRESGFADLRPGTASHSVAVRVGAPAIAALAVSGDIPVERTGFFADILKSAAIAIDRDLKAFRNF